MKKIALGLMVVTLIAALSLTAMAVDGECGPREHEAWRLRHDGTWVTMGTGELTARARAWSSGGMWGSCNKTSWPIDVTVHASVAQWIMFHISGTRYDWQVRKPGTYAADSLRAFIKSNGPVAVDFEGFGDLVGSGGGQGTTNTIPVWYAATNIGNPRDISEDQWIPALALNDRADVIQDTGDLHDGLHCHLWNKIQVVECNSACEYENIATITLSLQNVKGWIDPETGYFKQ